MIKSLIIFILMIIFTLWLVLFMKWKNFNSNGDTPTLPWKAISKIMNINPDNWNYYSPWWDHSPHLYYHYFNKETSKQKKMQIKLTFIGYLEFLIYIKATNISDKQEKRRKKKEDEYKNLELFIDMSKADIENFLNE